MMFIAKVTSNKCFSQCQFLLKGTKKLKSGAYIHLEALRDQATGSLFHYYVIPENSSQGFIQI